MDIIKRFDGVAGARRLRTALMAQRLVGGSEPIANELAEVGELVTVPSGMSIINEGSFSNELFFILAGTFAIRVKGSRVAERGPGDHVGEQALLDASHARTATVCATEQGVVLRLNEDRFDEIATKYPSVWKNMARELSRRLIQRNLKVKGSNEQVQVFIISSKEALWIAEEIRASLNSNEILCTVWTDGVFRASYYSLEALEAALDDKDFAIAVAAPDDFVKTRGEDHVVPRDNVIFELGMFMGRLGRRRTILLEPRDEDVKLPSDLAGLTTVPYRSGPKDKLPVLLGGPCHAIRRVIEELKSIP
jgi:CRP/FNR family transcriptional regulator, cyclic AMP receptor protein